MHVIMNGLQIMHFDFPIFFLFSMSFSKCIILLVSKKATQSVLGSVTCYVLV